MQRRGYDVTAAPDADQARAAFQMTAPETVIMDLRLPNPEDGMSLIREFRAAAPAVRIVVLSGASTDLDGRPEASMVDEILGKPVRSERLLEAIGGRSES